MSAARHRTVVAQGGHATSAQQLLFGRDPAADVCIDHATISSRHARLVRVAEGLALEDLGSTNGTWLRGERITRALVRPGDDVLLGALILPWGDPRVQAFVRSGPSSTVELPADAARAAVARAKAGHTRRPGRGGVLSALLSLVATILVGGAIVFALFRLTRRPQGSAIAEAAAPVAAPTDDGTTSEMEAAIRAQRAPGIVAAMDVSEPLTRNTSVKIASTVPGTFSLEQVAAIWSHARGRWRYVNDPRGGEYFAKASETITNDYAGDCDDFAIVVASMLTAVGGEARMVLMNGPGGGHAYAEVCVDVPAEAIAERLTRHYRRHPDPNIGRTRITGVSYRRDDACPVWLNLDWNGRMPGGPYETETWSVAVFPDGRTRTLTPATAPDAGVSSASDRRSR